LYNPATGEWMATDRPTQIGFRHTLTLLAGGLVLGTGGQSGDVSVAGVELYDPATGKWTTTAPLPRGRAAHSAILLKDGRVIVSGGFDGGCCDWRDTLDTSDLFELGVSVGNRRDAKRDPSKR
jgi:hypothetical protein